MTSHSTSPSPPLYYLSVGAIFKNEATTMKEWLDHYIKHGVDHFYLINDQSSDNFDEVIAPYLNKITLFNADFPRTLGRQTVAYKTYFTDILHETHWLAVMDLDEYLYCPEDIHIPNVLKRFEHVKNITANWVWFGSNGLEKQPESIVQGFTKRAEYGVKRVSTCRDGRILNDTRGNKAIINTTYHLPQWEVHWNGLNLSWEKGIEIFLINHYALMSKEHYYNIRTKRECCANDYNHDMKDKQYFEDWDIGDIIDTRLAEQNR